MNKILFKEESYKIIGACFEVYKELGSGFLESVYQESLRIEFLKRDVPFEEQPLISIYYKTEKLNQKYIPDFLCYDNILLEIKSVGNITNEHRAQLLNYLKGTKKKLGLLVNFGHYPKIEYERMVL